jgi:hypothetical protein
MTNYSIPTGLHPNTVAYNKQIGSAYADLFEAQAFQFHVTANFNRTTTLVHGRDKLRLWASRLERKLFGSRYYKRGNDGRIFFAAVPEYGHGSMNLHFHMLVRVPSNRHDDFERVAESIWKEFNPTGSLFIQLIGDTGEDQRKVISYDLKDSWKTDCHANIIFSSEFGGEISKPEISIVSMLPRVHLDH